MQKGFFIRKYKVQMEEKKVESGAKSTKDKEEFDDLEKAANDIPAIVIENEQDKSPPMSTFSNTPPPSKKEQLNDSLEDEENSEFKTKGEPDWGGLDDLLHDLDVKAGRDLGSGPVVAPPEVKSAGMDYAEVDEEGNEESKLLPKESAAPPVKAAAAPGGFDYDDIEDTDEATKLMPKEEDQDSPSKKTAEKDDIPDYAQVDKSRKTSAKEPLLSSESSAADDIPDYAVVNKDKKKNDS